MKDVDDVIREALVTHGRLPIPVEGLAVDDNLYDNGLSSHASVNVMLALEDAFEIEFPDALLRKGTFESITSIREALASIDVIAVPE